MENRYLELIKERSFQTKHRLICIRCGKWERMFEQKICQNLFVVTFCKSKLIAATFWSDEIKEIY